MKTLLEIANEYSEEELAKIEPCVGDRGMTNIDVEIFVDMFQRAFTDEDTLDIERIKNEENAFANYQKSINY